MLTDWLPMTKKDYIIIAKAIGNAIKNLAKANHSKLEDYQIAVLADSLCWEMGLDNPRFNSNRFKTELEKQVNFN